MELFLTCQLLDVSLGVNDVIEPVQALNRVVVRLYSNCT